MLNCGYRHFILVKRTHVYIFFKPLGIPRTVHPYIAGIFPFKRACVGYCKFKTLSRVARRRSEFRPRIGYGTRSYNTIFAVGTLILFHTDVCCIWVTCKRIFNSVRQKFRRTRLVYCTVIGNAQIF